MTYEQEILRILTQAGSTGLKAEKVATHVYNACNSIFQPLDYKDVRAFVTQYLQKNAKLPTSPIERGEGFGFYKLNFDSQQGQQILLQFAPHADETADNVAREPDSDQDLPDFFSFVD